MWRAVDGCLPLLPLSPYPLLTVKKRSSLDTTSHLPGCEPTLRLGPETGSDERRS